MPISFLQCDLASFPSIEKFAASFLASNERLDLLLAVAGVMMLPPGTTPQGHEVQFGTNHVGHALFIRLLQPLLIRSATSSPTTDVRVVLYSSEGAELLHPKGGIQFDKLHTDQDTFFALGSWRRYGQSKLANLLYARALARHLEPSGVLVVAVHPGVAKTELARGMRAWDRFILRSIMMGMYDSVEKVVLNGVWASVAPRKDGRNGAADSIGREEKLGLIETGQYYKPVGELGPQTEILTDDEVADRLWEWTEEELRGHTVDN